jgi:predicted transcriptional regulator
MVYLPEPAKRKIQEIAFHARRKENDVMLDAFREYLERQGFPGLV